MRGERASATRGFPFACLVLGALIAIVFGPVLLGAYVDDDLDLLQTSPAFRGVAHLGEAITSPFWGYDLSYWRPLTSAVMGIGHAIGNGAPWATHLGALLAHLASSLLVRRILLQLGVEARLALLLAAVFAVHPCQVESVAWVAALGDPLAGAATLWCVCCWLSWRQRGSVGLPWCAGLAFGLALASKESGLVALGWLVAVEVARPTAHERRPRSLGAGGLMMLAIVMLWWAARSAVFGDLAAGFDRGPWPTGAEGWQALLLRAWLLSAFVVLPTGWLGFTPYRMVPATGQQMLHSLPWLLAGVLLVVVIVVRCYRRQPRTTALAVIGFLATIAPVVLAPERIGPWPIVDRYAYLAMFAVVLVLLGTDRALPWLAAASVVVGAVVSATKVPNWRSQASVEAMAMRACPQHPEAHQLAGNLALDEGRDADALAEFTKALELLPQPLHGGVTLRKILEPSLRLGAARAKLNGKLIPPRQVLAEFDALVRAYPGDTAVWLERGRAAAGVNDARTAEASWQRAFELDPRCDQAAFDLGRLYAMLGKRDAARSWLQRAIEMQADNTAARDLLRQLR